MQAEKRQILDNLEELFEQHVIGVKRREFSVRNTDVVLRLLLDSKDLVAISARFVKLFHAPAMPPSVLDELREVEPVS